MPPLTLLPARFLFRFSFSVKRVDKLPGSAKNLLALAEHCPLPDLGSIDGEAGFATLGLAWNERGLGLAVAVRGKSRRAECSESNLESSDGIQIWVDTRNTQNIHRASRFCHSFCLLPAGGGAKRDAPVGVQQPIARAREDAPRCHPSEIRLAADVGKDGYRLGCWLPASVLNGFDPEIQPRLGFYYRVYDNELGEKHLCAGPEFPYAFDPSVWATLELAP